MSRVVRGTAQGARALAILMAVNWPGAGGPARVDALRLEETFHRRVDHGDSSAVSGSSRTVRKEADAEFIDVSAPLWGVEGDPTSTATFSRAETAGWSALVFRYALGPGRPVDQFAALVASVPHGLSRYGRVTFQARASRPLRLAVTLRSAGTNNPSRWQRSVYLDETLRTVTVSFDDMHAAPGEITGPVPLDSIGALMFVIDTNNTKPGTSGAITLSEIAFEY